MLSAIKIPKIFLSVVFSDLQGQKMKLSATIFERYLKTWILNYCLVSKRKMELKSVSSILLFLKTACSFFFCQILKHTHEGSRNTTHNSPATAREILIMSIWRSFPRKQTTFSKKCYRTKFYCPQISCQLCLQLCFWISLQHWKWMEEETLALNGK